MVSQKRKKGGHQLAPTRMVNHWEVSAPEPGNQRRLTQHNYLKKKFQNDFKLGLSNYPLYPVN